MKKFKTALIAATIMSSLAGSAIASTPTLDTEYPINSNIASVDGKVRASDFVAVQTFRLTKQEVSGVKVSHNTVKKEDAERIVKTHAPIDTVLLPVGKRYVDKKDIVPDNLLFTNIPVQMNRLHAVGDKQDTSLFAMDKNKTGIIQKESHAISFKYDIKLTQDTKKKLENVNMNMVVSQQVNNGEIVQDSFNRSGLSKVSIVKENGKTIPYNGTSWFAEQTVTGPMLVGVTPGTTYDQKEIGNQK